MVGFVCRPKKESRIEVPLPTALLAAKGLLYGRTPPFSDVDFWSDTDDWTAAKTTRANETPDAGPRERGFEAPGTAEMRLLDTSSCSFLVSSPLPWVFIRPALSGSERAERAVSAGDRPAGPSITPREQYSRFSAGGKAMLLACRSASSCSTLVSR